MESNFNKKVYINPNFKGNPHIQSFSTNSSKTYINRHYTGTQNKDYIGHSIPSNRKIYVNPNFIQTSNIQQDSSTVIPEGAHQNNEYITRISKYSFVRNISSNNVQNQSNQIVDSDKNTNTKIICNQTSNNNESTVTLSRSRYCIIRKKQTAHNKIEENNKNYGNVQNIMNFNHPSLGYPISTQESNIYTKKEPTEKVAKIKISKYKTVPITYLNRRNESNRLNKQSTTRPTKCEKQVKLLKTNHVLLTNKNTVKPISKTNLRINKTSWNNISKTKVMKAKFRINNIPCRLFTKYGKCLRQMYGNCQYLHDKKHVSLCRTFLKGICHDSSCFLSHELTAKKMPTCYFYLKGRCTKDNCPYVHIKKSENIKICQDFLKGYCEKGESCLFRHNKNEQGPRNNNSKRKRQPINKVMKCVKISKKYKKKEICNNQEDKLQDTGGCDVDHRYYKELVTDENTCQIKPTRCKLGILPSFIQL